jgi:hypothetical protein
MARGWSAMASNGWLALAVSFFCASSLLLYTTSATSGSVDTEVSLTTRQCVRYLSSFLLDAYASLDKSHSIASSSFGLFLNVYAHRKMILGIFFFYLHTSNSYKSDVYF